MNTNAIDEVPVLQANSGSSNTVPTDPAAQWAQACSAYPIYAALAQQFALAPLPYAEQEIPPARPTRKIFAHHLEWLDQMDEKLFAYQIRQLPPELLNAKESSLRAFIDRQLRKAAKTPADRDKIDFLLVQYFALCMPERLYRGEISFQDVASVLRPLLGDIDDVDQEWGRPFDKILTTLENCQSLRDVMENGLLEQGRLLKETAGSKFYSASALVTTCRFNFLLRRTFIRLLHEDLKAVRKAIDSLETNGAKTVDCRRAGLSAAERTGQLRRFCENWRQPFQQDYTESSVNTAFERILALRADLDEALKSRQASSEGDGDPVAQGANGNELMEPIRCQLTAANPNSNAMSTIVLSDTKVLLSSWEVSSFTGDDNPDAENIRRAVVSRVLLAMAMDERKRNGEGNSLLSAIVAAKEAVPYFQARVEQCKSTQNLEAAVNLGISVRRLLSSIEQAEGLRP